MRLVAVVQARMTSTRLPGKVLRPLGNQSILQTILCRLGKAAELNGIVVATSVDPSDDAVAREANKAGVSVSRGSLEDVLERFVGAAKMAEAHAVVRVTGDCPFIDPVIIDAMAKVFKSRPELDYYSNTLKRTFPRGLDAEFIRFASLERAAGNATLKYEREHVTPHFYTHPELFEIDGYVDPSGLDFSNLRWTLDTEEDYRFFKEVLHRLSAPNAGAIETRDVIELMKRFPELAQINGNVTQKTLRQ